jgi:hypothetical protein
LAQRVKESRMERIVIVLFIMIGFDFHPASVRQGEGMVSVLQIGMTERLLVSIEEVPR